MNSKHYIAQISDTHLVGNKNAEFNGVKPYSSLVNVLSHIASLDEKPELLILSGDNSQDATPDSYEHIKSLLKSCGIKYFLFSGNHDDVNIMNNVFGYKSNSVYGDFCLEFNNWFLCILNTSRFPNESGELSLEQLKNLGENLQNNKKKPTIIFMHHHPVNVHSKWIDNMALKDSDKFNKIIESNKQIKAVLFGHIHHVFEKQINQTIYASAPSTVYQVFSNRDEFLIEKRVPGYRLIELDRDKFTSKVVWVK